MTFMQYTLRREHTMLASQVNGNIYITDEERRLLEANQQAIKIKDDLSDIENEPVNQLIAKFDKCPDTEINEEKVVEAYNSYKEKLYNRYKLSKTPKPIRNNYVFEKDGYLFLSFDINRGTMHSCRGGNAYSGDWQYQKCHFQTLDTEGNIFLDIPYSIDTWRYSAYSCGEHNGDRSEYISWQTRGNRVVYPVFKGQTFKLLEGDISWFKVAYYEDRYYGNR